MLRSCSFHLAWCQVQSTTLGSHKSAGLLMDIVLLCEQRMIFCSVVLLTLPGIYCSPFDKPKSTNDHWSSCCFYSPCFLYPYFKIFILWELFFYFQRSVPFHRDRHTNEQARFAWSVWFYLFVTLDWHFPEFVFSWFCSHCRWFICVVFIVHLDLVESA